MGVIIPFERYKEKLEERSFGRQDLSSFVNSDVDDSTIKRLLNAMAGNVENIIFSPEAKEIEKREEEDYKNFYTRYRDVFKIIPHTVSGRIKYYAEVMLKLIPHMFHGSHKSRFDAFMDFGKFHYGELDKAESQYRKENAELEVEYPFTFETMNLKDLEKNTKDCLEKIIRHIPEKSNLDKTEVMYQLSRLFELDGLITDIMGEEVRANNNG